MCWGGNTVGMDDELLDIIDEQNNVVGQELKSIVHVRGLRHRVSAVLLRRDDGKYFVPTAAAQKVEAGGLYHSSAGHIPTGETYRAGALRELKEETGVTAHEEDLECLGAYWFEKDYPTRKERERFEIYRVRYTPEMGEIVLNEENVKPQWFGEEELKAIYTNEPQRLSANLKLTLKRIFVLGP